MANRHFDDTGRDIAAGFTQRGDQVNYPVGNSNPPVAYMQGNPSQYPIYQSFPMGASAIPGMDYPQPYVQVMVPIPIQMNPEQAPPLPPDSGNKGGFDERKVISSNRQNDLDYFMSRSDKKERKYRSRSRSPGELSDSNDRTYGSRSQSAEKISDNPFRKGDTKTISVDKRPENPFRKRKSKSRSPERLSENPFRRKRDRSVSREKVPENPFRKHIKTDSTENPFKRKIMHESPPPKSYRRSRSSSRKRESDSDRKRDRYREKRDRESRRDTREKYSEDGDRDRFDKSKERYRETREQRYEQKQRFSDNTKGRYSENREQYSEHTERYSESRDRYGETRKRFTDNMDRYNETEDRFSENRDAYSETRERFSDNRHHFRDNTRGNYREFSRRDNKSPFSDHEDNLGDESPRFTKARDNRYEQYEEASSERRNYVYSGRNYRNKGNYHDEIEERTSFSDHSFECDSQREEVERQRPCSRPSLSPLSDVSADKSGIGLKIHVSNKGRWIENESKPPPGAYRKTKLMENGMVIESSSGSKGRKPAPSRDVSLRQTKYIEDGAEVFFNEHSQRHKNRRSRDAVYEMEDISDVESYDSQREIEMDRCNSRSVTKGSSMWSGSGSHTHDGAGVNLDRNKIRDQLYVLNICMDYNNEPGCRNTFCRFLHVCKFHILGLCKFGDGCKRLHDVLGPQPFSLLKKRNPSIQRSKLFSEMVKDILFSRFKRNKLNREGDFQFRENTGNRAPPRAPRGPSVENIDSEESDAESVDSFDARYYREGAVPKKKKKDKNESKDDDKSELDDTNEEFDVIDEIVDDDGDDEHNANDESVVKTESEEVKIKIEVVDKSYESMKSKENSEKLCSSNKTETKLNVSVDMKSEKESDAGKKEKPVMKDNEIKSEKKSVTAVRDEQSQKGNQLKHDKGIKGKTSRGESDSKVNGSVKTEPTTQKAGRKAPNVVKPEKKKTSDVKSQNSKSSDLKSEKSKTTSDVKSEKSKTSEIKSVKQENCDNKVVRDDIKVVRDDSRSLSPVSVENIEDWDKLERYERISDDGLSDDDGDTGDVVDKVILDEDLESVSSNESSEEHDEDKDITPNKVAVPIGMNDPLVFNKSGNTGNAKSDTQSSTSTAGPQAGLVSDPFMPGAVQSAVFHPPVNLSVPPPVNFNVPPPMLPTSYPTLQQQAPLPRTPLFPMITSQGQSNINIPNPTFQTNFPPQGVLPLHMQPIGPVQVPTMVPPPGPVPSMVPPPGQLAPNLLQQPLNQSSPLVDHLPPKNLIKKVIDSLAQKQEARKKETEAKKNAEPASDAENKKKEVKRVDSDLNETMKKLWQFPHKNMIHMSIIEFVTETEAYKDEMVAEMVKLLVTINLPYVTLKKLQSVIKEKVQINIRTPADLRKILELYSNNFQIIETVDSDDDSDDEEVKKNVQIKPRVKLGFCSKHGYLPFYVGKCDCKQLHLCKFYFLSHCPNKNCKFGHKLKTDHNINTLKHHRLHRMTGEEIMEFLRDIDSRNIETVPGVCKFYNSNMSKESGCYKGDITDFQDICHNLHLCFYYVKGKCFVQDCKRSHSIRDTQPISLLKKYGLDPEMYGEDKILNLISLKTVDVKKRKEEKANQFQSTRSTRSSHTAPQTQSVAQTSVSQNATLFQKEGANKSDKSSVFNKSGNRSVADPTKSTKKSKKPSAKLPTVCKFFNNPKGCKKKDWGPGGYCLFLHVCQKYVNGQCRIGERCKRSHTFFSGEPAALITRYGIDLTRLTEQEILDTLKENENAVAELPMIGDDDDEEEVVEVGQSENVKMEESNATSSQSAVNDQTPFTSTAGMSAEYSSHNIDEVLKHIMRERGNAR